MKKEKILKVKLNETQEKILNDIIERTGLTKSEVVRYLLVFQSQNIPSKKEIERLQRELSAISNNLNQIAKKMNKYDREKKLQDLFDEFVEGIRELRKLSLVLDRYKK